MKIDLEIIRAILEEFLDTKDDPDLFVVDTLVIDQIIDCIKRTDKLQAELEYLLVNESMMKRDLALQEKKIVAVQSQCRHWILGCGRCTVCGKQV